MAIVNQKIESIQWDGTNAAEVVAFIDDSIFNWEVDGLLSFEAGGTEGASLQVNIGEYVIRTVRKDGKHALADVWPEAVYAQSWIEVL